MHVKLLQFWRILIVAEQSIQGHLRVKACSAVEKCKHFWRLISIQTTGPLPVKSEHCVLT